jgi:hypothetical protein
VEEEEEEEESDLSEDEFLSNLSKGSKRQKVLN